MPQELDPYIQDKLLAFRRRFRWLTLMRGACGGVSAFLGGLLILSLADWLIVMEDRTRYGLSGGVYLVGLLITWFMCIRPLLRVLDERELAAMMEREDPALKTKLLSAVELAEDGGKADSADFRKLAQQDVVDDLRGIQMSVLLPTGLIRSWLVAGAVVLLITGTVAAFESGRTLLLRAMAPMANIDRVSRNKIHVLAPEGGDASAPENDSLAIHIRVDGPKLEAVPLLESRTVKDGETETLQVMMTGVDGAVREYESSIAMARSEIQYRLHAGDAVSRWFTLKSVPRPFVMSFGKEYTYPAYTGRPADTLREENGDLAALSGTQVDLTIHLDQPVATAQLHLVTETQTNQIDFIRARPKEWQLTLPLTDNGTFSVHVETAGGLDNKFRPEYAITARPDAVPSIKIKEPSNALTARPEDVVAILGEAADDVGLKGVEQMVKINDQPWVTNAVNLAEAPGTNVTFKLDWDLLKLDAKPGDEVLTRFAAIDLKGSRVDSRPLKVKVDSALFEASRIAALDRQRVWTTNVLAAVDQTLAFHGEFPDDLDSLVLPGRDADRRSTATKALKALTQSVAQWKQIQQLLPSIARKANAGRETTGLGLVGQAAVRMEADWLARARLHVRPLENIVVDDRVSTHAAELPTLLEDIQVASGEVQATANGWLAADESALALDLLDYILRATQSMHRVAEADRDTDPRVWERLARRQTSLDKELEVVESTLAELTERLNGVQGVAVQTLHNDLEAALKTFGATLEAEPDEDLLKSGRQLETALEDAADQLRPLAWMLAEEVVDRRSALAKSVGATAGGVTRLQAALEAEETATKAYEDAKAKGEAVLKADSRRKAAGEILKAHWTIAAQLLQGRARLEESGKSVNALFVSDTAQAAQAIGAVREGVEIGRDLREVKAQLTGIAEAVQTIETAHELTVLEAAVKALSARERWEKKATDANSLRPRDWQWLRQRMAVTPELLKQAGLEEGADALEEALDGAAARAVGREMRERQKNPGVFLEKKPKKE